MKKIIMLLYATFILTIITGTAVHLALLDGLDGLFWSLMFKEDTRYAPGYSDVAFSKIRTGMAEAEVRQLLGAPLSVTLPDNQNDLMIMRYSESPKDTHYRFRIVCLRNGVVSEKESEFYVD